MSGNFLQLHFMSAKHAPCLANKLNELTITNLSHMKILPNAES